MEETEIRKEDDKMKLVLSKALTQFGLDAADYNVTRVESRDPVFSLELKKSNGSHDNKSTSTPSPSSSTSTSSSSSSSSSTLSSTSSSTSSSFISDCLFLRFRSRDKKSVI